MPEQIDYAFLSALEGGSLTTGYVPAANVSKSGVTIATGFDLGQRSESDLKNLGLASGLVTKLKPYLGTKGADAKTLIEKTPLTITAAEAESIDKATKASHIASVKLKYDSASAAKKNFIDLPAEAQTVIASVSFQYGVNLDAATPKFWKAVTEQDWTEAVKLLKNFGDVYPTRRGKEAALLEKVK
ncbi:pesticin C-terminus-like muramidase [Acidovorax sp. NCPPB 3576]|uniref:pesticin C-terminus-like muramidase n=1 Tax=Acidovorax sp. NCPPB 3576 TaxID=2940488 RepID=UPI002349F1DA|nr:pesticin C-terminus-like muramidase [Acidovorax sp. NCPPB 3576]WCM86399.1 pesticin C-terminus-like muramidase [Acidovorax sp. NCPPB 3576]